MKKNLIIAIISIVVAVTSLVIWLTPWVWYDTSPKPLGSQLEYIGKKDYGCWLGYCDSKPGTTYYYATDMSLEEVVGYFRGATVKKLENASGQASAGYFYIFLSFELSDKSKKTVLNYYDDANAVIKDMSLPNPSKEHAISLDASDYTLVKEAL